MASYPAAAGGSKIYVQPADVRRQAAAAFQQPHSKEANLSSHISTIEEEDVGIAFSTSRSHTHRSDSSGGHCHTDLNTSASQLDKRARRKLIIASILCLIFTIGEAVGGVLSGSLAIATDSAHMLTDFASFMISLLAIYISSRPATKQLSFGWHRAEILGALVSVQLIWIVTGILVYMAVQRVINPDYKIEALTMMISAAIAVAINILLGATLHGVGGSHGHTHGGGGHSHNDKQPLLDEESPPSYGSTASDFGPGFAGAHNAVKKKENMNVRAAFIHVIGDFIQSVGVLIASIIIYFKPEWKIVDPICTFLFSVLVLFSTMNILKDALRILMEDEQSDHQVILQEASKLVCNKYGVQEPTIQIEHYTSEMDECNHCQDPH